MNKQSKKLKLSLAGEFLVAGELLRRGITAVVTYGNAKKADVIAVWNDKTLHIEVKTTSQTKWVIGKSIPENDDTIWILVFIPEDEAKSPSYFVLKGSDLNKILLPIYESYNKDYPKKDGKPSERKGVYSVSQQLVEDTLADWSKIKQALGI
jgi:hypothetical protein